MWRPSEFESPLNSSKFGPFSFCGEIRSLILAHADDDDTPSQERKILVQIVLVTFAVQVGVTVLVADSFRNVSWDDSRVNLVL